MPPPAKIKSPDVGWSAKSKGYLCKVLVTPTNESGEQLWQAWSKNLDSIQPGIGRTIQEAIDVVKENTRTFIRAFVTKRVELTEEEKLELKGRVDLNAEAPRKLPWTEIVGYQPLGSSVKWMLVNNCPGPDGKMPEEEKQDAAAES